MPMKNPPHPGDFIRTEIIQPARLSVTAAAAALQVSRPALSSLLNGKAGAWAFHHTSGLFCNCRIRSLVSPSASTRRSAKSALDAEIWRQCQLEDRLLMTQDLDFADARKFQPGSHAGIVLVRLQNPGRVALFSLLRSIFRNHDIEAWKGFFVVLAETKIRIRRN